jgi:hypothetical protein
MHCDYPLSLLELQQLCGKHTSLSSVRTSVVYAALPEQQPGEAEAQLFLDQVQSEAAAGVLQQALDALDSLAALEELSLTVCCYVKRADLVAQLPEGLAARLSSLQLAVKAWQSKWDREAVESGERPPPRHVVRVAHQCRAACSSRAWRMSACSWRRGLSRRCRG